MDSEHWLPLGSCGPWNPFLTWLYRTSDIAAAFAYLAIALILLSSICSTKRRFERLTDRDVWVVRVTYSALALSCSIGHLEGPFAFVYPNYPAFAAVNALSALVAWSAVIVTFRMRAKIILGIS